MNLGPFQFLRPSRGDEEGDRILVVQSGVPFRFVRLLDILVERYPASRISALVRKGTELDIPTRPGVEYIANEGASPAFVRELRARGFSRVFVLLSNDPGFWKLKLLPFALSARTVYAVNENLGWFPVDAAHLHVLAQHLRARIESSISFAGDARPASLEALAKTAAYPAVLAYLFAFERAHNVAASLRGVVPWKRENRPQRRGPSGGVS